MAKYQGGDTLYKMSKLWFLLEEVIWRDFGEQALGADFIDVKLSNVTPLITTNV